jgi:hypothetical protein
LNISVKREQLLRELGYREPPEPKILEIVEDVLGLLDDLIEPRLVFKEIGHQEGLPSFLAGAALQYAGSSTLGPKLEKRVKAFFDGGKPAESYVLDTAGSVAITQAGNLLWQRIRRDAASRGFTGGLRRTPGCRGIEMETQRWIFQMLADAEPGITLTESCMMVPRKSLSFLARFGGKLKQAFSCKGCPQYAVCTLRGY